MSRFLTKGLLVLLLVCQTGTFGGDKQGNGGDHVRSVFLRVGGAAMKFVETTPAGRALIDRGIEPDRLRATLSILRITVEEKALYDSNGILAHSLAGPGWISLHGPSWLTYFERQDDIYFLAFHLMLLSAGYADDGNLLSRALFPFPTALRVPTRATTGAVPESSGEMPYAERRRHLVSRCDKLAARLSDPAELRMILGLQEEILVQTPAQLPADADAARYRGLLDGYERKLNELDAAHPPKEER